MLLLEELTRVGTQRDVIYYTPRHVVISCMLSVSHRVGNLAKIERDRGREYKREEGEKWEIRGRTVTTHTTL